MRTLELQQMEWDYQRLLLSRERARNRNLHGLVHYIDEWLKEIRPLLRKLRNECCERPN